ncbi:MAG: hypothetical protein AAGC72_08280, partial [Planctomycetota bacterium]
EDATIKASRARSNDDLVIADLLVRRGDVINLHRSNQPKTMRVSTEPHAVRDSLISVFIGILQEKVRKLLRTHGEHPRLLKPFVVDSVAGSS